MPRPANDVPPDILIDDSEDETPVAEAGSEIELDLEASPGSVKAGTEVIKRVWSTLPNAPGVYRMIDAKGEVLYIGKAKSLKARVGSYARGEAHSNRLARMIADTAAMEFVTTATEAEALLLEAFQIKRCSGPCTKEIATDEYRTLVEEARAFLSGKSNAVKERLVGEMNEAAE